MSRKYRAIFAPSYNGSTLLSSLLNSFADTTSIGELHWTLDHPIERVLCSECGKDCPIVRPLIRRRERGELNDQNLYSSVLDVTRKSNLWTSDKHRRNVERFLPTHGDGAIIIFKRPEQLLASGKRHNSPWVSAFLGEGSVYTKIYEGVLHWLPTWTDRIYFCDYNHLVSDTQSEIESIGNFFGLELKPGGLQYPPVNWHNVGGNRAWKNEYFQKTIKADTRWKTELSSKEKKQVLACPAQRMYRRLCRLAKKVRQ